MARRDIYHTPEGRISSVPDGYHMAKPSIILMNGDQCLHRRVHIRELLLDIDRPQVLAGAAVAGGAGGDQLLVPDDLLG